MAEAAARTAVLGTIRIGCWVIAAAAAAAGIGYLIVVATGSPAYVTGPAGDRGFQPLPLALSLTFATAFLLTTLTAAVMALVLGDLAWRIRQGVTFAPTLSRSAWQLAIILAVGSWLARIAQTIAQQSGLVYPDGVDPSQVRIAELPIAWAVVPSSFAPDLPLLGLAVVLAVLASIVHAGERLQRDTDGLV